MRRINVAAAGFGLAAFLFGIAAVLPSIRGGSLNATFLAVAVVFFVLAIAAGRKSAKPPSSSGPD